VILAAGLTPAWQHTLVFGRFRQGEVNRAAQWHWCASGKVFNVGIAAHRLGGPSLTLAPVGGLPSPQIDRDLDSLGVPHRFITTAALTRVCTTIIDQATGSMTELVESGLPLSSDELDQFLRAYADEAARAEVAVITGSLPVGTPVAFYRDLVERTRCPAVLDFRGEGLLSVLNMKPYVVKPNREELGQTVGRPLTTDSELCEAMQSLNRRGAVWAVVTQGGGPVWVTSATKVYRLFPPPPEKIVNPIGCGDALAAAIAWATRDGRDMIEAVRFGIAAAGKNIGQLLPCRFDPAGIVRRVEQVRVEEVFV
jgi:tagatose 6-phosphate kinase